MIGFSGLMCQGILNQGITSENQSITSEIGCPQSFVKQTVNFECFSFWFLELMSVISDQKSLQSGAIPAKFNHKPAQNYVAHSRGSFQAPYSYDKDAAKFASFLKKKKKKQACTFAILCAFLDKISQLCLSWVLTCASHLMQYLCKQNDAQLVDIKLLHVSVSWFGTNFFQRGLTMIMDKSKTDSLDVLPEAVERERSYTKGAAFGSSCCVSFLASIPRSSWRYFSRSASASAVNPRLACDLSTDSPSAKIVEYWKICELCESARSVRCVNVDVHTLSVECRRHW